MLVSSISGIGYCPLWPLLGESPRLWKASSSLGVSSGGGLRLYGAFRVCELGRGMCISQCGGTGDLPLQPLLPSHLNTVLPVLVLCASILCSLCSGGRP